MLYILISFWYLHFLLLSMNPLACNWELSPPLLLACHSKHLFCLFYYYQRWENKQHLPVPQIKIGDQVFVLAKFIRTTQPSRKLSKKYLGLFKVTGQSDTYSYLTRLLEHLRLIHSVFYISQLEPTPSSQIPNCYNVPPLSVEVMGYLKFEVAQILDSKLNKQQKDPLLHYVCWAGYEDTSKEYS